MIKLRCIFRNRMNMIENNLWLFKCSKFSRGIFSNPINLTVTLWIKTRGDIIWRVNKTEIKFQGQSLKFLRNYKLYLGRKFYKNNQICATKEKRNNVRSDEKEKNWKSQIKKCKIIFVWIHSWLVKKHILYWDFKDVIVIFRFLRIL